MNHLLHTTLSHATSSANSNNSADDLRTRTGNDARHKTEQKQRFLRAKRARCKLMRQRRVPDDFRPSVAAACPCQRSRIGRQPDIRLLFTERGVGKGAAHVRRRRTSPSTTLCMAANI